MTTLTQEDLRALRTAADMQGLASEFAALEQAAFRYQAIREAHKSMQLYLYDEPDDPFSGYWEYNPDPVVVDQFADGLIAERAAAGSQA